MSGVFPIGMGGVVGFGKLPAIIQGSLLSIFGWSLLGSTLISISFVLLALILLTDMCRRLGYSSGFTFCFIAFVGLTESFVAASQKTRYEFLALFLLSLALWLTARRHVTLAIFVAALAAEAEPAAIVVPCAVLTAILVQDINDRRQGRPYLGLGIFARILLGALPALGIYLLLHPHTISIIRSADWRPIQNAAFPGGFVLSYYFHLKRHLPEFAVLITAIVVCFIHKRFLLVQWPALCIITIVVVSALLRWPNPPYFCFISPFLGLFILQTFYTEQLRNWLLAGIFLLTLPQYVYRYYYWASRHAGFSQQEENQVNAAINRTAVLLGKSPEQLKIIGNFNLWFAHPNGFINLAKGDATNTMLNSADLLLCFDQAIDPILERAISLELTCHDLDRIPYRMGETLDLHGNQVHLRIPNHSTLSQTIPSVGSQ